MKKIIAMLVVFVMVLSASSSAFAVNAPNLDFLKQLALVKDVEENATVKIKLNEPFGLLELMAKESVGISDRIDIKMLMESLCDSTLYVNSKTKSEAGGEKRLTESHIKSDVVFKANSNLEGQLKTNYSFWSEFDVSDKENPYFEMITTHPFASKYITVDSDLLIRNEEATKDDISMLCTALSGGENLMWMNDIAIKSMEKNALITGNSQKVRISFTDMGLKTYFMEVISSVFNGIDERILEDMDTDELTRVMSAVPFFGNEALSIEYTLDSKSRISTEKTVLNVNLNIYDLMLALNQEEPPAESGITRDMCKINFTVETKSDFKYNSVKIEKPMLDENNSVDIFEYEDPYYYEYEDYYDDEYYGDDYDEEDYYYPWIYADIDKNCFANGEIRYVQLRSFLEDMGYEVSCENGIIQAKTDSNGVKYKGLGFIVGSDVAYTDICDIGLYVPLFTKDGVTYISVADCEFLADATRDAVYYYFDSRSGYVEFVDNSYLQERNQE